MPLMGFEPTISAGEWPQTYALDRVATGTGSEIAGHRKLCTGMSYQIVCVCVCPICDARIQLGTMVPHC